MVSHLVYIFLERLLWVSAMGIFKIIYDYQTLITGGAALVAAYIAARPVYRQLGLVQIQSNGVRREMLLQRQLEIEQACAAVREKVGKALSDLSREFDCYEEEHLDFVLNEHQAHHHDLGISHAASWLRQRYKWRDNALAEAKKAALLDELEKLTGILQDVHYPAHTEQHDEYHSMSDEVYAAFLAKGEAAKAEINPALIGAESALQNFQDSLAQELNAVILHLKKLDSSLVSVN